jgi:predicted nuclease of predicted toxin-antitoxin system
MSRPRFLADQDFNEHILRGLQRAEPAVEVLRLREVGLEERPDPEVLAYAAAEGWIVLSHDVNTMSAAATARQVAGQPFNGLFLVHQQSPIAPVIEDLVLIWASSDAEEWAYQVWYLPL